MENSILKSTKKILGIDGDYTAFDLDIITHINASFSVLDQIGIGPVGGFYIEDSGPRWQDLNLPQAQLNMVRTYVFLKVRMLFDPPTTSFLIDAMEKQISEYEYRLSVNREMVLHPLEEEVIEVIEEEVIT